MSTIFVEQVGEQVAIVVEINGRKARIRMSHEVAASLCCQLMKAAGMKSIVEVPDK
jgi:hypothetical protein